MRLLQIPLSSARSFVCLLRKQSFPLQWWMVSLFLMERILQASFAFKMFEQQKKTRSRLQNAFEAVTLSVELWYALFSHIHARELFSTQQRYLWVMLEVMS